MPEDNSHATVEPESLPPGYRAWRRIHLLASWSVTAIGLAHSVVTAFAFDAWTAGAVWFLGAGIGVLAVGTLNLAHIGLVPCRMPTAKFVRVVNSVYFIFGVAALVAVQEPQAIALVAALGIQAVASRVTMPGPVRR
jgi:hypothetical protein